MRRAALSRLHPSFPITVVAALGNSLPRFIRGFEIVLRKGFLDPFDEALNAGSFGIADAADMHQAFGMAGHAVEETFILAGLLSGLALDNPRNESRKSRG